MTSASERSQVAPPQSVRLLIDAAHRLGMSTRLLDADSGYLLEVRRGDEVRRVLGSLTGLNPAVCARLSQDKMYTCLLLRDAGFPAPESVRCVRPGYFQEPAYRSEDGLTAGLRFAETRGFPVIVKPNRLSGGRHVALVRDRDELERAVRTVWRDDYLALVQPVIAGRDLRVNLLDGELLLAYWRRSTAIRGDGVRTVRELMGARDARYADERFFARCTETMSWHRRITARGMDQHTVLAQGESIDFGEVVLDLRHFAGASLIDELPAAWLDWCTGIARCMQLRYLGIDIKVPDADDHVSLSQLDPGQSTIIETNASPNMAQLCELGHEERALRAQMRIVQALFT